MVKGKSHLGKKKLLAISSEWKDTHISNFPRSKRTLKHITARGSCARKLFKVFQLYTCLKCTQSTLIVTDMCIFLAFVFMEFVSSIRHTIENIFLFIKKSKTPGIIHLLTCKWLQRKPEHHTLNN